MVRFNRMRHGLATGNKRSDANEPGFKFTESECFRDDGRTVMGSLKLPYQQCREQEKLAAVGAE